MTVLKWIAWALIVLPVAFLLGCLAGGTAEAWSELVSKWLKL